MRNLSKLSLLRDGCMFAHQFAMCFGSAGVKIKPGLLGIVLVTHSLQEILEGLRKKYSWKKSQVSKGSLRVRCL